MHKYLGVVASVPILAVTSTLVWAAWGCAHRSDNGQHGVGYAHSTEAEAKMAALAACRAGGGKGCYIVGCSPNADTEAEAATLWPQLATPTGVGIRCGSPGEPKC